MSAALLSPIAYVNQVTSVLVKAGVGENLAEVEMSPPPPPNEITKLHH